MVYGGTGVQAFFILSGFLITSLLISEVETTGTISIKNFFMRRTLRIVPLYILFLLVVTVIYFIDEQVTTKTSLLFAYAYIYNFVPYEFYTSFLGHTWSLAVEEHFYIIWPFIFLFAFQLRRTALLVFLCLCILLSPLLHFLLVKAGVSHIYFVERWTFIAGYNIAVGCVVAILMLSGTSRFAIQQFLGGRLSLVLCGVLFAFPSTVYGLSWTFDAILSGYFRCLGLAGAIGWLYVNQGSAAVKFLESKPLKYLGTISYGIYMYQGLFLATGPARQEGHLWPPSPVTGLLCVIVVAPLSYHFFEKRFIRLKSKFKPG